MDIISKNLDILDALNIFSFIIGYLNYQENLTQTDKQDIMHAFDKQTKTLLNDINNHLVNQDIKINKIMEVLNIENNKESGEND